MMTTNKNQRTTHIDDVVKYQPTQAVHFFSVLSLSSSAHCVRYATLSTIIYACILNSQMKMMKLLTLTLLCVRTRAHSFAQSRTLFLSPALNLTLGFIFEFLSSTIFTSFAAQNIYIIIFFFATLYFILLFVCAKLCVAPNGEKKICV